MPCTGFSGFLELESCAEWNAFFNVLLLQSSGCLPLKAVCFNMFNKLEYEFNKMGYEHHYYLSSIELMIGKNRDIEKNRLKHLEHTFLSERTLRLSNILGHCDQGNLLLLK